MKPAIENHRPSGCGRQAELRFTRSEVESDKAIRLNDSMKSGVLQSFAMILFLTAAFRVTAQQTWGALGNGLARGNVEALQVVGGTLYAGGSFNDPAANYIAQWNGTAWVAVGTSGLGGTVQALATLNGNLYVAGQLGSAGVMEWDGNFWSSPGGGGTGSDIYALAVRGSTLYAGGNFQTLIYYDTSLSQWNSIGSFPGLNDRAYAIAITDDGTIYVGGSAGTSPNTTPILYKWNPAGSGSWDSVTGTHAPTGGTAVRALVARGNDLYVGGSFTTVGGNIAVRGLAKLSGTTWSDVAAAAPLWLPCDTGQSVVRAIAWNGSGELCVTGYLPKDGGGSQNHFFLLINGTWASVPATGLVNGTADQGRALAVDSYAGRIYVGGSFDHAGTVAANNVAVWNEFRPYTIIDLGTLSANTYSYGMAVSKNGLVGVGYSQALVGGAYRDHAFSSTGSDTITDLGWSGPWSTNDNTYIYGMNDSSIFIGTADYYGSGTFLRAFRNYLPDTWVLLNPISASYNSHGDAINNNGDAVGYSGNSSGVDRATLWTAGHTSATDLQSLAGSGLGNASYAYGINKDGYIVGKSYYSGGGTKFHAFQNTTPYLVLNSSADLGSMGGATKESIAYAINDFKQIVGSSQDSGGVWRAFIKTPDSGTGAGFTDLGAGANSYAYAINSSGQVVGTVGNNSAFIWQNDLGYKNLQNLLPAGSGWTLKSATAINDSGTIVGWGYLSGYNYVHGFLMTP